MDSSDINWIIWYYSPFIIISPGVTGIIGAWGAGCGCVGMFSLLFMISNFRKANIKYFLNVKHETPEYV